MRKKMWALLGATAMMAGAGSQIVGQYKVFFCCGGCKGSFNKLPKKEQERRVEQAAKTQEENAKKS